MPCYFLLAMLFALAAGTGTAQEDRTKEDQKKLQGKWKVTSCTFDGKDVAEEVGNGWTFDKNKLLVEKATEEMTITLNAAKRPKEMEMRVGKAPQPVKGIYEIDGELLKFCYGTKENDRRPERFESKPGSGRLLIILKRAGDGPENNPIAHRSDDAELLKKEIDLLKKEIELLKKENETLKKENTGLKKGSGSVKEKEGDETKESINRVTVDNVEYVYAGSIRNGNAFIVTVLATSKNGNRPVPRGQMILIDETGEKYTGNMVGGTNAGLRELREGVSLKLQWQFGGNRAFGLGDRGPQAPGNKVKRFTAVIIENGQPGRNNNTIEFRNVPVVK
jgi:uncharacterized protein (TIGR03067 family)